MTKLVFGKRCATRQIRERGLTLQPHYRAGPVVTINTAGIGVTDTDRSVDEPAWRASNDAIPITSCSGSSRRLRVEIRSTTSHWTRFWKVL